jgi:RNA-binding protein YhbY
MKVEEITIINVDDVPYAVSDMSDGVKSLVGFYNEWRQKESDLKGDILLVQAGQRDLSREIITMIRREKEDAEAVKLAEDKANAEEAAKAVTEAEDAEIVEPEVVEPEVAEDTDNA